MIYPKIKNVKTIKDRYIEVVFDNGCKKKYDIEKKIKDKRFEALKNKGFFKSVKIDSGGYGISWNDEIDISEYELWKEGI